MSDETTEVAAPAAEPIQTTTPAVEPAKEAEPVAEVTDTEDSAPSEADSGQEPAEGEPKKKGGVQKRFSEITREKYEAIARAERAEKALAERDKPAEVKDPGARPKLDEHTTLEAYDQAMEKWNNDAVAYAKQQGAEEAKRDQQRQSDEQKAIATKAVMQEREDNARRKFPDYDAVINPFAGVIMGNPVLKQYVLEEGAGTDMAYHLAKNPALLADITRLGPVAAIKELTRLEARLAAPPKKTLSQAPAPVKPVGSQEAVKQNLTELAQKEDTTAYALKRQKQRLAKK